MPSVRVQAFAGRPHIAARQSYTQIQALQALWQADINDRKGRKLIVSTGLPTWQRLGRFSLACGSQKGYDNSGFWRRKKMRLFLRISHSFTIQRSYSVNYLRRKK